MRNSIGVDIVVIAALCWMPSAFAQMLTEEARACAAQSDDAHRLACYDREIGRLIAKEPHAAAVAPAKAPAPEASFGARGSEVARKQEQASPPQPGNLTAKIAKVDQRPRGERVMTLDNGQVWVERSAASFFPVKVGDQITIQAGTLGSYRLQLPSGRSTLVTRLE